MGSERMARELVMNFNIFRYRVAWRDPAGLVLGFTNDKLPGGLLPRYRSSMLCS